MLQAAIPPDILIVGAGISGIGMAAQLAQDCPGRRFEILDARERPGGTWDLFRYPGVRSDSDMYTLGYSFAPWRGARSIASGAEIRAYLDEVIARFDLAGRMTLGARVLRADWDSKARLWTLALRTARGEEVRRARFLFVGAGYYDYDEPYHAEIPGIDRFAGPVLHPQFWPADFDPAGKAIAVIGSGATAATLVPALAAAGARKVTMIQRTPSWYYAENSKDRIADLARKHLPARMAHALIRWRNVALHDFFYRKARKDGAEVGAWLQDRVRKDLGPAFDAAAFGPPYGPWEQRLCFVPDGDLFAALRSGQARIATGAIAGIDARGVTLTDGTAIEADVLVTATGLRLAALGKIALSIDGVALDPAQHWHYRNCMLSDVPNFAALSGYLNAAWTGRVELVAQWLCRLFRQMDAWGADVVVPRLPAGPLPEEGDGLAGFSSGYLARGRGLMPRSAAQGPWRLSHDYLADRRTLAETPIDDGLLAFSRAP